MCINVFKDNAIKCYFLFLINKFVILLRNSFTYVTFVKDNNHLYMKYNLKLKILPECSDHN